jgi:GTPase SAR1 family protein
MCPLYYRGANIILICYDISDILSYKSVICWIKEIMESNITATDSIIYVIANKYDKINDKFEDNIALCESNKFVHNLSTKYPNIKFFIVSSKTGSNINDLYESLVQDTIALHKTKAHTQSENNIVIINDNSVLSTIKSFFIIKSCY